jgi:hypothetical protein
VWATESMYSTPAPKHPHAQSLTHRQQSIDAWTSGVLICSMISRFSLYCHHSQLSTLRDPQDWKQHNWRHLHDENDASRHRNDDPIGNHDGLLLHCNKAIKIMQHDHWHNVPHLATYWLQTSRKIKKHSSLGVYALWARCLTPRSCIVLRSMTWISISCAIGGPSCGSTISAPSGQGRLFT